MQVLFLYGWDEKQNRYTEQWETQPTPTSSDNNKGMLESAVQLGQSAFTNKGVELLQVDTNDGVVLSSERGSMARCKQKPVGDAMKITSKRRFYELQKRGVFPGPSAYSVRSRRPIYFQDAILTCLEVRRRNVGE